MKKILLGILGLMTIFTLSGCQQAKDITAEIKEKMGHPDHEKVDNAHEILDNVLAHIADHHSKLSFEDGELLDSELGVPRFNVVSYSEIEHFNEEEVVDGFIVRPVVDVDNPKLLIVLEAVDKEASMNLNQVLEKVKSDQWVKYRDGGLLIDHLINTNQIVRQGNYLIYVTWEGVEEIVKVFERHVR